MKHTIGDLQQMQSLPLSAKTIMTKQRIKAWYDYWDGQVYVSFSGGKDSTVIFENGKYFTTGCKRTGCIFCMFGAHCRDDNRFLLLKQTHPRQYEYCMEGGAYDEDGFWKPTKEGLGMKHVIDELHNLYGNEFIKY